MTKDIPIKCCSIASGVYLYADIKERLNRRYLYGSMADIEDITDDGHTWITVRVHFTHEYPDAMLADTLKYIQGMVAGILLWSGVEVV